MSKNEEFMNKKELEQYFTALKNDSDSFREEVNQRFEPVNQRFESVDQRFNDLESKMDKGFRRLESVCFTILEIVRSHDLKFTDFEKQLVGLERKVI